MRSRRKITCLGRPKNITINPLLPACFRFPLTNFTDYCYDLFLLQYLYRGSCISFVFIDIEVAEEAVMDEEEVITTMGIWRIDVIKGSILVQPYLRHLVITLRNLIQKEGSHLLPRMTLMKEALSGLLPEEVQEG